MSLFALDSDTVSLLEKGHPTVLARIRILRYSEAAIARFHDLLKAKLNVRANDLRIAAVALEHSATVVTRNVRDFIVVPGLNVEDWTRP